MRPPAVAGMFYPRDGRELLRMISGLLENSKKPAYSGKLRGLVVPHAGYIYSGIVAAAGYNIVLKQRGNFDDVILMGPSHFASFPGAASTGNDVWETPLGVVEVSGVEGRGISVLPEVHEGEHSLEVQVPFLQIACPKAVVRPLLLGDADAGQAADAIDGAIGERTLIIASSDLSHYYPYGKAVGIDSVANRCIPALDIGCVGREVEACGKGAVLALMHIAKRRGWKGMLVDYRNSGDTSGDMSQVVGYGCYAFLSE